MDSDHSYRVYRLRNPAGRHYLGITNDVRNRLEQHNAGLSTWTRGKGPWHLVWTSSPRSLSEARKLENLLKRQKGGRSLLDLLDQEADKGP